MLHVWPGRRSYNASFTVESAVKGGGLNILTDLSIDQAKTIISALVIMGLSASCGSKLI